MCYSDDLIGWYLKYRRDLPFRKEKDPYRIWVSEVMAQQTRIEQMMPYYLKWMDRWPTLEDFARASIEDVLHLWQGLGYYNRARRLHEGAKFTLLNYNGKLPGEVELLKKISGIGNYTAGAIASIAYNVKAPAIDGNVLRVISRNFEIKEEVNKKATVDFIYNEVFELMGESEPSLFTQALMELGALVCTYKNPSCSTCPLIQYCKAYHSATVLNYPVKKKAKKATIIQVHTYFIKNKKNQILISDDDSDGLMAGLKRLPQYLEIKKELKQAKFIQRRKHVFSHRVWDMKCYVLEADVVALDGAKWIDIEQLNQVSMVTAHRKWIKDLMGE